MAAEQTVEGNPLTSATIAEAHPLTHNEYKMALVKSLVRSALMELTR